MTFLKSSPHFCRFAGIRGYCDRTFVATVSLAAGRVRRSGWSQ